MSTMTLSMAPDGPHTAGDPSSFVTVFANLLPEEIAAARRARQVRRRVLSGLAALLVLIVCCYGLSRWQTGHARAQLTSTQDRTLALQHRQRSYAPLVRAQTRSAEIQATLRTLMAGDLQWTHLLGALRGGAGHGVTVSTVAATMDTTSAAAGQAGSGGGPAVLNQTGNQQVGTIAITGTASSQNAVAAYVDMLSKVPGLAAPLPASVTGDKGALTFSVNVVITTKALGGRFTSTQGGN